MNGAISGGQKSFVITKALLPIYDHHVIGAKWQGAYARSSCAWTHITLRSFAYVQFASETELSTEMNMTSIMTTKQQRTFGKR